jgi:predicted dehydrogenase
MEAGINMVKDGRIGEIERVEVWAPGYNAVDSPVCVEEPVPDNFDFDLWTGPAPLNTYCPDRVTNNSSWFQWDYSIGFLGGWGAHPLDIMVWALKDKLNGIYSAKGNGEFWKPGGMYNNIRAWQVDLETDTGIKIKFVDNDAVNAANMINYRTVKESNGTTFYGTKGWISLSRHVAESNIPELQNEFDAFLTPFGKKDWGGFNTEKNTMGQLFVDVVKGNIPETCPLDEAIISDGFSHMSNIAIREGKKITWDSAAGKVVDNEAANQWFVREMRKPYVV